MNSNDPTTQRPNDLTTEPESAHGRVAKNASIYFVAQILGWVANIMVMSLIPRALGEVPVGKFFYILNIVLTAALCFMLGGEMYLTVEIGRDRSSANRLIGAMLGLRLVLAPLFLAANLGFFALARDIDAVMWQMIFLLTVAGVMTLLSDPLRAVMVSLEDSKRVSLLDIIFTLAPLLTLPFLRYGVVTQAICYLLSSIVVFVLRCRIIGKAIALRPRFDPSLWKRILLGGLPYQANNIILQAYTMTSVFMLKHFADYEAVGVYSQAQKLFGTFLFVPTALGMALLPSLARMAEASEQEFRQTQSRVLILLIILALPMTTIVFFMAAPISHLLYGAKKYVDMPLVLQVYAFAIAPTYVVSTMYQFLVAQKRGGLWTIFLAASVVLFAGFAALLIPYTLRVYHSGAMGAAGAVVLAESCSSAFALMLLGNNPFSGKALRRLACALFATGGMAAVMWVTRFLFPLVSLAVGLMVFGILAWRLRILTKDEQQRVHAFIQKLRRRG